MKHELVNLDHLEFSFHDETLAELGMSPSEMELLVPRFVVQERAKEIAYWEERMEEARDKLEQSEMEVRIRENIYRYRLCHELVKPMLANIPRLVSQRQ